MPRRITQKEYRRTKMGFLVQLYGRMRRRVKGKETRAPHLYINLPILPSKDFYNWATADQEFNRLFNLWEQSDYSRAWLPSVDRVDSDLGYVISNMEWVTFSENCRRAHV